MGGRTEDDRGVDALAPIISDSSGLIGLTRIHRLELLANLFGRVLIPPAVALETARAVAPSDWLVEHPLVQPIDRRVLRASLGPGETEVISLALELDRIGVVLDERLGRRLAKALGVPVVGTVGVLLQAKRRGLLTAVRPELDA